MKKKVLILQTGIYNYRVAIFNQLANYYDLSVTYAEKDDSPEDALYKRIRIKESHIGPFRFHKIRSLCKQYDVVVYMPSLHRISFWSIPLLPHRYKTVSLAIGMRASYTRRLDINRAMTFLDKLFGLSQFKADAVLVYFKEVLAFWKPKEIILKKCFQTRNTTDVLYYSNKELNKDSILFIGTLYKEKRVDSLILSYKEVFDKYPNSIPNLEIIGSGNQVEELKSLVSQLGLDNKVFMRGAIYDEKTLSAYFLKSIVSVSPNQAGLSVPKSMGYGVPFVTIKDAITGGEIFHIKDGVNGLILNSLDWLPSLIEDVVLNKDKYIQMGINARQYYEKEANINTMVGGFRDAIEYALNS